MESNSVIIITASENQRIESITIYSIDHNTMECRAIKPASSLSNYSLRKLPTKYVDDDKNTKEGFDIKTRCTETDHSEKNTQGSTNCWKMNVKNDHKHCILKDEASTSKDKKLLTRKRKRNVSEWSRIKNKLLKNSGKAYEGTNTKKRYPQKSIGPTCECKMNCGSKFTAQQRKDLFDSFYGLCNRESQWSYITRHVKKEEVKRMTLERKSKRTQTLKYFFPLDGTEVHVCKKFFINTLNIGESIIYTAIDKAKSGKCLQDQRGKHKNRPRKMRSDTESSIVTHIRLFSKVDSHDTSDGSYRQCLSEELNVSKLYRSYTDWFVKQNYTNVVMATQRQYETIFHIKFNYSFFRPKRQMFVPELI